MKYVKYCGRREKNYEKKIGGDFMYSGPCSRDDRM